MANFCAYCGRRLDGKECICKGESKEPEKLNLKTTVKDSFNLILDYLKKPQETLNNYYDKLHISTTMVLFTINMLVTFCYVFFRFEQNTMYNYYSSFQLSSFENKKDLINGTILLNNGVEFVNASTQVLLYYVLAIVAIIAILVVLHDKDYEKIKNFINCLSINTIYTTIAIVIMIGWGNSSVYLIFVSRIILLFTVIFAINSNVGSYEKIFKNKFSALIGSGLVTIYYVSFLMLCLKVI